jgi:hypothetical protein
LSTKALSGRLASEHRIKARVARSTISAILARGTSGVWNLSRLEIGEMILALTVAIAHESEVVSRLESDEEFRTLRESVEDRHEQIARFQRLLEKFKRVHRRSASGERRAR